MHPTPRSNKRRRPLSLGEVGLFIALVCGMFVLATVRSAEPGEASALVPGDMALMNIAGKKAVVPEPDLLVDPSAGRVPPVQAEPDQAQPTDTTPMFNNRPIRRVRQMSMLTTAYSPDERSCGKWADGFTASGYSVWTNGMKLVAADTSILPFGTLVSIPGYNGGKPVPVLDRGGKIKGNRLDLLYPTHNIALKWGAQRLTVDVWEYAD